MENESCLADDGLHSVEALGKINVSIPAKYLVLDRGVAVVRFKTDQCNTGNVSFGFSSYVSCMVKMGCSWSVVLICM